MKIIKELHVSMSKERAKELSEALSAAHLETKRIRMTRNIEVEVGAEADDPDLVYLLVQQVKQEAED